jgi:hypothetical protein
MCQGMPLVFVNGKVQVGVYDLPVFLKLVLLSSNVMHMSVMRDRVLILTDAKHNPGRSVWSNENVTLGLNAVYVSRYP